MEGLIQKLSYTLAKLFKLSQNYLNFFNINILKTLDTNTYVCMSGGYSMLIVKRSALSNFWMILKRW